MKAAVLNEAGPAANLRIGEVADPEPGAGEVVIRVLAAGVCGHDLLVRAGAIPAPLPAVLGHELAGTVEALGPGADGFAVGDRVSVTARGACGECSECRQGHENRCRTPRAYGENRHGGYAERCVVAAADLARVPEGVSDEAAAIASCGIGTSIHALEQLGVQAGERILVTGAGGGVGAHALQVIRHRGAVPIAATSSPEKASALEAWADTVVVAQGGKVREALRRDGVRIDKALDLTAGITLPDVLASLPAGGRVCAVGNVRTDPVPVHPGLVIVRELEIVGSVGARKRDLEEALALLASGAVTAAVGTTLPLAEAAEAHASMESSRVTGRVVLKP